MDYKKISDTSVKDKTGKNWKEWFAILDRFHAPSVGHAATAKYLHVKHKLNSWWSQVVTIRYEKERGYWERHGK